MSGSYDWVGTAVSAFATILKQQAYQDKLWFIRRTKRWIRWLQTRTEYFQLDVSKGFHYTMLLKPDTALNVSRSARLYTLSDKNPSAWNFLSPEPEVTYGTVAIIIRVVLLSPYLCFRGVSLSSIHYSQSHTVYMNQRQKYICLIWN